MTEPGPKLSRTLEASDFGSIPAREVTIKAQEDGSIAATHLPSSRVGFGRSPAQAVRNLRGLGGFA